MKTVLVIDDDPKFRESLTGLLKQFGYHALEAANGREAVDTIERLRTGIDLMIVDLALPEISGVELIGAVTRRKTTIKIIATSAVFDEAYLEMVKGVGADETIRKAAIRQPEKWLEIVRRLLGETGETAARPSQRVVLVVDDEESVRSYVRRVLQGAGYQVLEAADGVDALALLEKLSGAVDLLVTDVKMPRLPGIELVKAVKGQFPAIPVIYISSIRRDGLHDPRRSVIFVEKPFTPEVLLEAVQELLPAISMKIG